MSIGSPILLASAILKRIGDSGQSACSHHGIANRIGARELGGGDLVAKDNKIRERGNSARSKRTGRCTECRIESSAIKPLVRDLIDFDGNAFLRRADRRHRRLKSLSDRRGRCIGELGRS